MKLLVLLCLAPALAGQSNNPKITAPDDVAVLVFQADPGICQIAEGRGNPCPQHVTVFLFPHEGPATYRVTISYHQPLFSTPIVETKTAVPLDYDGSESVSFLVNEAFLDAVKVDKIVVPLKVVPPKLSR